jgi:protein gp37
VAENSKIEWTDHTFNPWHGCTKVSPACDHCYAEAFSRRIGFSEAGSKFPIWGKDAERRFFGDEHWNEPLKWNRAAEREGVRKRVFCGSMCDVMESYSGAGHLVKETIEESRHWLLRIIERTPNLDWLLLTKRPQNFRRFLPDNWLRGSMPENIWGMTTVESADYLWRVQELQRVPFRVRGLSIEPLLGPIFLAQFLWGISDRIHWAIVGGESGHGARPMHPDWARKLRDQCKEAKVAFHFKQWGEWVSVSEVAGPGKHYHFPDGVTVRRVGKKAAGRTLDGRTWDEVPELRSVT